VPDNGQAVAGFVLSIVAGTLLVVTAGLSSIVSVICAGLGIVYSLRGRRKVDRGETPQHRGLAQAGFIVGIVSLVLAILATVGWILFLVFADLGDLDSLDSPNGFETTVRVLARFGVLHTV
jgi:hypothetical protein